MFKDILRDVKAYKKSDDNKVLKTINLEIVPHLEEMTDGKYLASVNLYGTRIEEIGESPTEACEKLHVILSAEFGTKSYSNTITRMNNEEVMKKWANKNTIKPKHDPTKGTLHLCYMGNLKNINVMAYPIRLFAVRSAKDDTMAGLQKYNFTLIPQLSPSAKLFSDYFRWKKGDFTQEELDEIQAAGVEEDASIEQKYWALYVPRFYEELATRQDLIKNMKRLLQRLDEGKNVLLMCYCYNLNYCHRKIIGIEVAKRGYKVIFE